MESSRLERWAVYRVPYCVVRCSTLAKEKKEMTQQNKLDSDRSREMQQELEESCEMPEDCPVCDEELDCDLYCENCGEFRNE